MFRISLVLLRISARDKASMEISLPTRCHSLMQHKLHRQPLGYSVPQTMGNLRGRSQSLASATTTTWIFMLCETTSAMSLCCSEIPYEGLPTLLAILTRQTLASTKINIQSSWVLKCLLLLESQTPCS